MDYDILDILRYAIEQRASDVHITVKLPPMIRKDTVLMPYGEYQLMPADTEALTMSVLNDHQKEILEKNGEVDFSYIVPGISRFRVNAYKQRGSYGIAFRVIAIKIPTLDELGFPEVLKALAMKPRGLVLVTGPTGSGKSTTLAAMVHHINTTRKCHILTLEEPIEYLHTHRLSMVNQREVGGDTQSFHNGLRAALREDPDVILVGEMRDLETISTAITAAETGHLVMSTLHTTGAAQTIDRIIDVFPPFQQQQIQIQLSAVLEGIISQQLVARQDQPGMIAVQEILIATGAVRNLVRDGKTNQIQTIIQTNSKLGMRSMDLSLSEAVRRGIISREQAFSYAVDREILQKYLAGF
jgi:twitching motility protein PilT